MEVHEKLSEIVEVVDTARSMPMSSTVMVNKQQLLVLLDEVREGLPGNLLAAEAVLGQREALLIEARGNAERIIANARAEHARLVADHAVTQTARLEAEEIVRLAREQADAIRSDADDYVDAKLARLEVAAQRIAETVRDGREQLRNPMSYDELSRRRHVREPEPLASEDTPATGEGDKLEEATVPQLDQSAPSDTPARKSAVRTAKPAKSVKDAKDTKASKTAEAAKTPEAAKTSASSAKV